MGVDLSELVHRQQPIDNATKTNNIVQTSCRDGPEKGGQDGQLAGQAARVQDKQEAVACSRPPAPGPSQMAVKLVRIS